MSNAAGIIFSNLNDNTLSRLTMDRTVAAIPFGCRYRLVDFALSNMVNAGITNISIIANYNYRSLTKHVGSGKDWDLARRAGGIEFISPFQTARTPYANMYSHHLEALKSMHQFIGEIKEEVVVLSDTDNICNIDLSAAITQHKANEADLTLITTSCGEDFTCKASNVMVDANAAGKIQRIAKASKFTPGFADRFINIYIVNTAYLRIILEDALSGNLRSLSEDVLMNHPEGHRYYVYRFDGYVAPVTSFMDYYRHSISLATTPEIRRQLFGEKERPIYTNVHNSAPVLYSEGSEVKNSMIADGCVIEGTVENSILFRGVHVARGAVVKNSVLFGGTQVGEGTTVNCVVTDKDVTISANTTLSGADTLPFYISKGRHI